MSAVLKLFLILMFVLTTQCKNKEINIKNKTETRIKEPFVKIKKKNKKKLETPWDSLSKENVTAFFTEYGAQHTASKVLINTKFGTIKMRLYEDVPVHRANFLFLTKMAYFDTTVIYRVAKNFVIQGGNSDETYTRKQRRLFGNYLLAPEFKSHRKHKYGALAAARQWKNNPKKLSNAFEFYIVHNKKGAHHLDNQHTVFGEVISGFDTMDKISNVQVGVDEWPIEDIKMKITVLD
jgi:cyclophilin family peptidyl-prolyl cis-trans isomerase